MFINKIKVNVKYRLIISVLTMFTFAFIIYAFLDTFIFRIKINDGYAVGDWMINYEDGGFKRRGLSGTCIMFLSRMTGVYVGKIIFFINIFCYILFGFQCIYLWSKKRWKIDNFIVLLLPTSLFFIINDEYAVGRKETLLYVMYMFFLIVLNKYKSINWKWTAFFTIVLLFTLLLHELVLFYFPYFLIVVYVNDKINKEKIEYIKYITFTSVIILSSLIIFLFGGDLNQGNTWLILKNYGLSKDVMYGILSWPKEGFGANKLNALPFAKEHNYITYIIPFIITYSVFIISFLRIDLLKKIKKEFLFLIIGEFIFTLPLFYLTIDWGRWIHIHTIMLLLTFFYFTSQNNFHFFETIQLKFRLKKISGMIAVILIVIFVLFNSSSKHVDKGYIIGKSNTYLELKQIYYYILEWLR
jgi:hypothetical protein